MARSDKRETILKAAETLVKSRRFHEITLDEVAQAAKVGKGTIYRYFKDKEDLFFELATHGFDELYALMYGHIAREDPFERKLVSMCHQIESFFLTRRSLVRIILEQEGRKDSFHKDTLQRWLERKRRFVSAVEEFLQDGVDQGLIREDMDLEFQAQMLMGLLRERYIGFSDDPASMPAIEMVVKLFLSGVGTKELQESTRGDRLSA